jgi:hypothetical protein
MASTPPGIGTARIEKEGPTTRDDHFHGWALALEHALENIGRAPGRYRVDLTLSAVVEIKNPGHIVEYIATLT